MTCAEKEEAVHNGESQPLKEITEISNGNSKSKAALAFEEVLECIGSRGKFQRRLNIVFVCIGPCLNLMTVHMFYLGMQTPDHWCHVPGREQTNLSMEEWKNITIPREGDTFSKCLMYNQSDASNFSSEAAVVKCQHGWDYDETWFSLTAPSQMDWVCDNQHAVTDVFFYSQNIGVALGLLFGYIGDMFGRRPQELLCISAYVAGRLLAVLAPQLLPLFIVAASLVCAAGGPMIESALSVALELTDVRHRTAVNLYGSCCLACGMVLAGLLVWALPDWNYFVSFSAVSCFALLCFFKWFPESPRWLACRGREQEALAVVRRIADTNGCSVPPFALQVIQRVAECKTDRTGFLSLFSSWNVFRNTAVLVIVRSVHLLTVFSPVMALGGLSVNPFAAVASQGAAQVAAMFAANHCAARLGRRWSAVAAPTMAALASALVSCLVTVPGAGAAVVSATMLLQFSSTASIALANLQSIELHPTCLRQIAACVEWAVAGVFMSALPYLALLDDKRVPFAILAVLNLVTAFCVSFLPETALQRLPESLQDGARFGRGQRYWSWRPRPPPRYTAE